MGLIPLPKKIDKKERLRKHMQEFFKDFVIEPQDIFAELDYFFSTSTKFSTREEAQINLDQNIDTVVHFMDYWAGAGAGYASEEYILRYPNFYLPICEDMPEIILSKSIDGFNGQYSSRNDFLNINMTPTGGKMQWFGSIVHEYAHRITADVDEISSGTNLLTAVLQEYITSNWDELSTVDEDEYVRMIQINKFSEDIKTDFNRNQVRQDFDIGGYKYKINKLDETIVRLKVNIAFSSEYHSIDDIWDEHPFTDKMVDLLTRLCWPDKKPIVKYLSRKQYMAELLE
jgi:hypothetical protein